MVQANRNDDFVEGQQERITNHVWVVILVLVALGIGFYSYNSINAPAPVDNSMSIPEKTLNPEMILKETAPSLMETEKPKDKNADETSFLLPELDNSDSLVRQVAPSVSSHPVFVSWLAPDELIRTFTLLIDNISRGDLIRKHLKHFAPKQRFKARELADGVYITDPTSYRRFDLFVEIFDSIEPRIFTALYLKLQPLFQEAYGELGYPDQDFDKVILAAADIILAAPVITRTLKFDRPSVMFKFNDKKMEDLNDVHKQMIRMGPKNTKKIQAKIGAFAELLRGTKS